MNHVLMPGNRVLLAAVALIWIASVAPAAPGEDRSEAQMFAEPIEAAHGIGAWKTKQAVQYDIRIEFGGNVTFDGRTIFEIGRERVRMESRDGDLAMVWDGEDAWYWPADANMSGPSPRFHLRTWTYFLAAPFKLRDPGSHLQLRYGMPLREGEGRHYDVAKLSFGEGVGDAPDDWYMLYRDPQSRRLAGMAYIVTYTKDVQEAEQSPSMIIYEQYEEFDGVTLSTQWRFHHWSLRKGAHGEPKGMVTISNLRFVELEGDEFEHPAGAAKDELPR